MKSKQAWTATSLPGANELGPLTPSPGTQPANLSRHTHVANECYAILRHAERRNDVPLGRGIGDVIHKTGSTAQRIELPPKQNETTATGSTRQKFNKVWTVAFLDIFTRTSNISRPSPILLLLVVVVVVAVVEVVVISSTMESTVMRQIVKRGITIQNPRWPHQCTSGPELYLSSYYYYYYFY